ncbi:MAG: hypothetical protein QM765_53490 [Myxococcales bacterium]
MFDITRFHQQPLDTWLSTLPAGWDSYPDCRVKGALVREMMTGCDVGPDLLGRLPAPVAGLFRRPPNRSEWLPAVLVVGLITSVAREARWDARRLETMARASTERLSAKIGLLLALTTPGILLVVARMRWNLVYRGVGLTWEEQSTKALLIHLTYPEHLLTEVYALGQGWALEPALAATRIEDLKMEMVEWTPARATYRATWR